MQTTLKSGTYRRSHSLVSAWTTSFLCVTVLAGYAWGQGKPTDPAPKAKAKPPVKVQPAPKDAGGVAVKDKVKPAPRTPNRRRAGSTFQADPNAKWACDQQTVALEPVWRGDKQLTFTFNIRNEGTADLKIKARGG